MTGSRNRQVAALRLAIRRRLCRVGLHRWLETIDRPPSMPGHVLVVRYCPFCLTRWQRPAADLVIEDEEGP